MPANRAKHLGAVALVVTVGLAAAFSSASAPATQTTTKIAVVSVPRGPGPQTNATVYVVNNDGSGKRTLARNVWPDAASWSPGGRKLAFVRGFGVPGQDPVNTEVYVMNADGSAQRRLTRNAGYDFFPAWSPDGRKIAFDRAYQPYPKTPSKRFYYRTEIYVMNVDGSGRRTLTDGVRPLWSPDGQKILFFRRGRVTGGLYVMNADGSGQRRLARDADLAAWSPAAR